MSTRMHLCLWLVMWAAIQCVPALAQDKRIVSCVPNTGVVGQQLDVIVKGKFTNFIQNQVTVAMGPWVTVLRTEVRDFETLVLRIEIDQQAMEGSVDIQVNVGSEMFMLPAGFKLIKPNGTLTAVLEVFPMQTVSVSDFTLDNLKQAPIISQVMVYNDQKQRSFLSVILTLSGDKYGLIGSSKKTIRPVSPNQIIRFNNREFDKYNLNTANNKLMEAITRTSTLPADSYDYLLEVFDEQNIKVAETRTSLNISNLITRPEALGPGVLYGNLIEELSNPNPQFQWFSQASKFEFALYPVLPGQSSQEEVLLNRPVFVKKEITSSSLLYPPSAELLENGQVYAWQVKGYFYTAKGVELLPSNVFWFKFIKQKSTIIKPGSIKISPLFTEVGTHQKVKFSAEVYDKDQKFVGIADGSIPGLNIKWKIVPEGKAQISKDGLFESGSMPTAVAVIAEVNGVNEYATVIIKTQSEAVENKKLQLIDGLFGLPTSENKKR